MRDHSIYIDQAIYATSFVVRYLDNVTVKTITNFYKTTLPSDMIFTKSYVYAGDDQVGKLTRSFNMRYKACIVSLIYLLYKRFDLISAVHKLEKFSSNFGKVHFEGLVHLLRYIRDNKIL